MVAPATATSLLPISLEQLSTRASLIFYGEVINNQVKKDDISGQIATYTEFKVIQLIKGKTTSVHTIKQLGGIDKNSNINFHIRGVPRFEKNRRYVVFLPEKSSYGFSSPLGLHQGSFTVFSENGEQLVSNGQNLSQQGQPTANKNVQLPLAVDINKPSQARLEDFINTVRAYNAP